MIVTKLIGSSLAASMQRVQHANISKSIAQEIVDSVLNARQPISKIALMCALPSGVSTFFNRRATFAPLIRHEF
jgi:hypothetical protein